MSSKPHYCSIKGCTSNSTDKDISLFRFPRDPQRCSIWVKNCGRSDLLNFSADALYKNYRLCSFHFDSTAFSSLQLNRLKRTAVPTVFTTNINTFIDPMPCLKCIVCGYSEDEVKKLHYFPSNLNKSKIWQESMGMVFAGDSRHGYRICSRHFTIDSYVNTLLHTLKKDAVPTLFSVTQSAVNQRLASGGRRPRYTQLAAAWPFCGTLLCYFGYCHLFYL